MASDQTMTVLSQRRPSAKFIVEHGPQKGTDFAVTGKPMILGRAIDADIVLADKECSRHHARIQWLPGELVIEDLRSSNGTYVNGEKITVHVIETGDRISMGQTTLVLEVEEVQVDAVDETILREQGLIPARAVLNEAMATSQRLGNENLGFLSESHGFMPTSDPVLFMPPSHAAWDEMVERMPELHRTLSLRRSFDAMPVLSAAEADLPDAFLLRAATIIGIFSYSYFRAEADPPAKIADSLMLPWLEISRRLDRHGPVLSYIDLIIYNWKLIDPTWDDPIQAENLSLLVPTVDNTIERIFYLGQIEILSRLTPAVGAIVRAQEAVHRDDTEALKRELGIITDALHLVTHNSLMKISLNPYSGGYYVDPVSWAKTVAPLAVSIEDGVPGPSGIASPIFHLLDEFFGRELYASRLGIEMAHIRDWYPKNWKDFLKAIKQISVADYVQNSNDPTLQGIFQEATQSYVAESGFLGRHRLKVYGYLETAFKVGRTVTIGSFSGEFKDRAWDEVHTQLNESRLERGKAFPQFFHYANVSEVNTLSEEGSNWVKQIVLDVAGTGVRYQAGDRCAILPENSEALINKMLTVLQATGEESIRLDVVWREAITFREGYEEATTLPLRTMLKFGRIRPVSRPIAKGLFALTHNEELKRIIEARAEDQWELWDLIEMLSKGGFDPRRLWKAHPGEQGSIGRVAPPESFRTYSISSVMENDTVEGASQIHFTIGRLLYETEETEVSINAERLGTASNYLGDTTVVSPEDMGRVSFRVMHPPRFSLPKDTTTPIVMFGGGTGFAPFRSFMLERGGQAAPGESWLFFGTRTTRDIYYQDELEQMSGQGWLNVRIAFSRDETYLNSSNGRFAFEPGARQYIGDEMLRDENARVLWDLIRSQEDGGKGAYLYVCGKTGFANAVTEAIKEIVYRFSEGSEQDKQMAAEQELYRLVGEDRYLQEIFTTYTGAHTEEQQTFDASEIALHNNEQDGYWMIIGGRVYDVSEFLHLHPGGHNLIREYAGMDATQAYQKVLHDINPEVDSMLGMYEIGRVRRLHFGMAWSVLIGTKGLESITLANAYRIWMRFLYFVVELENALFNEFTIQDLSTTRDEAPEERSPYKIRLLLMIQKRFLSSYITNVAGENLESLWAVTSGLCAPDEDVRWMGQAIKALGEKNEAQTIAWISDELMGRLETAAQNNAAQNDPAIESLIGYCQLFETESKQFMRELRFALLEGIKVFEEFEHETINFGGERLLASIKQVPAVLDAYYTRLAARVDKLEN